MILGYYTFLRCTLIYKSNYQFIFFQMEYPPNLFVTQIDNSKKIVKERKCKSVDILMEFSIT